MSWVMLSRTCTRISMGERFFALAMSAVISSIVFSPVLLSQRLAMPPLPKYRELASLISTILPSGSLAMCPFFLGLHVGGFDSIVAGPWAASNRSLASGLISSGVHAASQR